jgi:chromosome segregation ATPase
MPRRTIADARATLERAAEALNPEMFRRYTSELKQAEDRAGGIADSYASERAANLTELRDELLEEACELRDDYAALMAEGGEGMLTAQEYQKRYEALEHQKRRLARRGQELDHMVAAVERIEEDPVAWVDQTFYATYHQLMPTFSF